MVKLNKQTCPPLLYKNKDDWTRKLLTYTKKGIKPPASIQGKYRHPDIKSAVIQDSHGKCIYCESEITSISYGDIEHLKPKSVYPELTFEWDNLGLACTKCNVKKNNNFDSALPYINPYLEDPEDFFMALSIYIYSKPESKRGKITELSLELNRPELLESRKERIELIRSLVENYVSETNVSLKKLLLDQIKKELSPKKPYSFCAKSFYEQYLKTNL